MKTLFRITLIAICVAGIAETDVPVIKVTASAQTAEHADIHEVLRTEQ